MDQTQSPSLTTIDRCTLTLCRNLWLCVVLQVEMFRSVLGKTLGFVGYTIQYGCIAHCAFEYIGELVVVRIIKTTELMTDKRHLSC